MKTSDELKNMVREKYGQIAEQTKKQNESSCCGGSSCCNTVDYAVMSENYAQLHGYNPDADLGLGCGLPTEYASIKQGDVVVDLGSGAGNDCFVARALTGEKGKVIGVDMTDKMIAKAQENAAKLGFHNVEFIKGEIENLPLPDKTANVVISNCVMNLVPDKEKAFRETYRILKPGGHFSISDIVITGTMPENLKQDAEMYVGCIAGAIQKEEYLKVIENAGFKKVRIQKEKLIDLPAELLNNYLDENEAKEYGNSFAVLSITVYGEA